MRKETIFKGAATALITPMTESGVDYESLARLIDWQIAEGINGLVICGTTGESSTLTDEEHRAVIEFAVKRAARRVPVIAGTGSNDTEYAAELTKFSCSAGADACLVVTPYYNKATQKGLVKHYFRIADASDKPIILYNVPSRTGVNVEPKTYLELSEHPNVCAIKEANGQIGKMMETAALVGDKLDIYSGNDDHIVPVLSIGGKGVISVLSNVLPKKTARLCELFFNGDVKEALRIQLETLNLVSSLFSEVNPIPVKYAMSKMGFCENVLRLPLCEMEEKNALKLLECMRAEGLNV